MDSFPDEVGVFLDLLHSFGIGHIGSADALVQIVNIGEHLTATRVGDGFPCQMLANLAEDPGIPHGSPSDHQSPRPGFIEHHFRIPCCGDIPIGQHRARKGVCCHSDQIMPDAAAIHLEHRATMDCHKIEGMFCKKWQQSLDGSFVIESQPRLDCELSRDGIAQCSKNGVDPGDVTQQSSARTLAIDDGCRTSEIQINGCNGIVILQEFGRANE